MGLITGIYKYSLCIAWWIFLGHHQIPTPWISTQHRFYSKERVIHSFDSKHMRIQVSSLKGNCRRPIQSLCLPYSVPTDRSAIGWSGFMMFCPYSESSLPGFERDVTTVGRN